MQRAATQKWRREKTMGESLCVWALAEQEYHELSRDFQQHFFGYSSGGPGLATCVVYRR